MDELDGDNNFFMNDVDYADYQYCSTPEQNTEDEFDDESSPQEFTITDMRRIAGGFIINSSVYISDDNWETIVTLDNAKRLYCAVCDLYINVENCEKHLATPAHGLNKFKNAPMKRFELSMTRKIKQGYHCGVCNITFDDPDAHSETKKHSEKMLFAINKANDLLYDSFNNTVRNETIKLPDSNPSYGNDYEYFNSTVIFDNNNDDENNNDESDKDDENNNDESDKDDENDKDSNNNSDLDFAGESIWQTTISYAQIAKKETEKVPKELKIDLGDKIVTVKYDSWNMIVYTSRNHFYCMACKDTGVRRAKFEHCISEPHLARLSACKVVRAYETHLVRRVGENLFHCGHCNNLQPMHEMEIHIEEKHPKLRLRIDKHKLEHELGENIGHNTQRPILKNEATPIKNKMMKSVQFVDENNVPTNNMKENFVPNQTFWEKNNVSTNFTTKTEEFNNENTIPSREITENGILKHSETQNGCPIFSFVSFDKPPPNYKPLDSKEDVISSIDVQPKIFNGSIMLTCQFGFQIYVSVESFNTILRQNDVIKCLVCDISLDGEPQEHMFHDLHVEMLQRVAFIPEFTCNLIRLLRNQIHCVICNTTILNDRKSITNHISEYEHGLMLKKALFLKNAPASFSEPGFGVCKDIELVPPPPPPFIVEPPKDFQDVTGVEEIDPDHANRQPDYRYVIVKLRNVYLKVQEDGWHTLVYRGDGTNYCFCCDQIVLNTEVYNHMNTKGHARSVDGHLVLDMYGINLLRQVENLYHCAFCNVIISKKNLEAHLKWPPHLENTEQALITAPDRRSRDMERMMGIFEVEALTQKEKYDGITDNVKDAILYNVQITKKRNIKNNEFTEKHSKMVIFNNDVYKIDFDNWNGFVVSKDGYKCNLCNCEIKKGGLESHFGSKIHADNVEKPILKVEAYGLVREVSDHMLYCVLCNLSLTKKDISSHCGGKRHAKSLEEIRDTSGEDQYSDCHEEPYIV